MNKLNIVYEDKHLIIVDKPCKMLTIGTEKDKINTLYHEVYVYLHKKNQKVFIVNRLDKDTSGLVVFAKSEKVKDVLQSSWDNVIRKYYAIVCGKAKKSDKIEEYLKETSTHLTYVAKDGKKAITLYKRLKEKGKYSLLDIEIKTGRKNQIRVALESSLIPILGDTKYGDTKASRMYLHAYYLSFIHPITHEKISLDTGIPKEFGEII